MLILRERLTIGVLAQLTTQWPVFFMVRGSTPAGGKFFFGRFVLFFRGLFLALSREISGYFSLQIILKK